MSTRKGQRISNNKIRAFRNDVWAYYKVHGRHDLSWRKTKDAYKILVSEVMLQQTQVPRVIEKYHDFLKAFPNVQTLAQAPLSEVLKVWSGMGYNRRAKYLRETAKEIVEKHGGKIPREYAELCALPGIGDYTAKAVRVFAYNEPDVLIETNVRAAFIHHFFQDVLNISDRELLAHIKKAAPKGNPLSASWRSGPREWHWALMDYGSHIKKLHKNPARRSAHYTRQSKFEGSLRQVRGAVLKALSSDESINDIRCRYEDKFDLALAGLSKDGLVKKEKGKWRIT